MHRLAILRFCRDELAERQRNDKWQGWFWGVRRKVIDYWISVLARPLDAAGSVCEPAPPDLTPEERKFVRRSHPLLAARPVGSAAALQLDRHWKAELHRRVEAYIAALKSHR
jgi:hypothetical protein